MAFLPSKFHYMEHTLFLNMASTQSHKNCRLHVVDESNIKSIPPPRIDNGHDNRINWTV